MGDPRMAMREFLTPSQRELYTTNAWFRLGVDTFAQMVQVLVRGLEVDAREKGEAMERDVEHLRRHAEPLKLTP